MNTRGKIKLTLAAMLIVLVAELLQGSDVLTGAFLTILLLAATAKVAWAVRHRNSHGGSEPGGSGPDGRGRPVKGPAGGRPPLLREAAELPVTE